MPLNFDDLIPTQGRTGIFDDMLATPPAPKLVGKRAGKAAAPGIFDDMLAAPPQQSGGLSFDDLIPQTGQLNLNIGGRTVRVDRSFLNLSPDQQNATVDEIAKSIGAPGAGDISQLSDAELLRQLRQGGSSSALASMSDADLLKALGRQPDDTSTLGDVAKSAGIGLAKGAIGLAGLPADLANLGAQGIDYLRGSNLQRYTQPIADVAGGQALQKDVEGFTGPFYQPKTTAGQYAQTIGEFAPAAIGGPETLAPRLATRVVAPALASEAAGQLAEGTGLEPYARIAGAVVGGGIPTLASRVVSPATISGERAAAADLLQNEGVTALTAGQKSGSKALQYAESHLGDTPGAGNQATAANQLAHQQFTQAALRRAGVDAPLATPEVLDQALTDNSNAFNTLAANNPIIPMPKTFWNDAQDVADDYEKLTGSRSPLLDGFIDNLRGAQSPTQIPVGTNNPASISGQTYQAIQSQMANFARRAANNPDLKLSLYDMRATLDGAVQQGLKLAGNTTDAAAWQQARAQYKNLLVIERAMANTTEAAANGIITPTQLAMADKAVNGRRAYVRGASTFSDLAHAGNAVMKPLPQSGTAPRAAAHLLPALLGAAAFGGLHEVAAAAAGAAAPAIAGRLIHTRPTQAYLSNQVAVPLRSVPLRRNLLTGPILAAPGAQQSQ